MVQFVRASQLYDVERRERVAYEWPTDGIREVSP